uniref:Thaumatin-like protein L1 n=1 Tax=Pinus monticola TaxID=3345 RepID=D3IZ05_PINMO|nr:thaumatin-like protein L1 [Pinus monticola]
MGLILRSRALALLLILFSGGAIMVICAKTSPLTITIMNSCPTTIWPGLQASEGHDVLEQGGFALESLKSRSFSVANPWNGVVWARTGCSFSGEKGSCLTGDCDGKLQCNGTGGRNPVTLAQLSLHHGGNDVSSYTLSLVNGFNLPLTFTPHGGRGRCGIPRCMANMLESCPKELQVKNGDNVIACKTACQAFRTDAYCCTSQHYNGSRTCPPTTYSQIFKRACPNAFAYPDDNPALVHNCVTPNEIKLIFCH